LRQGTAIAPRVIAPEDGVRNLVERSKAGDRHAFDALHARFSAMVHAIALATAGHADAEIVTQDVFVAAWRAVGSLNDGEHFGAWLRTITRNCARGHIHRNSSTPQPPQPPLDVAAADRNPSEGREILGVVLGLPETYRETLVMRLVEGMTGPEIAERTGLTHGSVRVNLTRGMKLLREALRERGWP